MTTALYPRTSNDSPVVRWTVLFIVATAMMTGYFVNDVMSPLETLLERPVADGGLGWTPSDYGFFSGASGFINVFLLMLFFSGIILDKAGIRFTGTLACSLMVIGTLVKFYAVSAGFEPASTVSLPFGGASLPVSVAVASLGFAVFGVGYEMTGIAVSKAVVRWFTGHEMALAMGLQLAMARLGTAAALSLSPLVARHYSLSAPLLLALGLLVVGLLAFLVFCVLDRRLDGADGTTAAPAGKDEEEFRWSDIGVTLRSPGFWLITLFCVLFYSAVSPFLKFSTRLLIMKYGVDADVAGFFSSIVPFGTIVLTPLFGLAYDRHGRGVTLIIIGSLLLSTVHFAFSLPLAPSPDGVSPALAIVLMVALSVAYSLVPAALWPCLPKIVPLKCLGTASAMVFYIQNFGRAIIPMLVGLANAADPTYTTSMLIFGFTALGAALVAVAMLLVDRRHGYGLQLPNIQA